MIKWQCHLILRGDIVNKLRIVTVLVFTVGILFLSAGIVLNSEESIKKIKSTTTARELEANEAAASVSLVFKDDAIKDNYKNNSILTEVKMKTSNASVIIPPRVEVYEGLTMEELAEKINRNLGNDYIAGKGYLIATECLSRGVDPYIAVAIMLHETGCKSHCSALTRTCNNVGGQKGAPGCNGGSYKAFATLDEGIVGFISNLEKNYFKVGLTTIDTIGPRYAESTTWPQKIHWYVDQIRAS